MTKKLFVGNIEWGVSQEELRALFEKYGEIYDDEVGPNGRQRDWVVIINDRETGRPRGFGFVHYANEEDADKAMEELNGYELNGRELFIKEARPQEPRGEWRREWRVVQMDTSADEDDDDMAMAA